MGEKASIFTAPGIISRSPDVAQAGRPFFIRKGVVKHYEITKALWAANEKAMLLIERGKGRLAQGDWKAALSGFESAIGLFEGGIRRQPELAGELQNKIAECHGNCGYALLMLCDRGRAEAEFKAALKLDPTCFEAHLHSGHAKLQGDPEGANLQYLMALESLQNKLLKFSDIKGELEPDIPYCFHCIGNALSKAGKRGLAAFYYGEAAGLYKKEIENRPELADGLGQLLALCEESRSRLAP